MIIKQKDARTEDIQELNRLLSLNLSSKQRSLIERELKCVMSGNSGESSAAYYLDFRYKDNNNFIVMHDLRIEHKGLVAQIDHLLINRFLDIRIIESKNYFYGVKITEDGEFLSYNGKGYQAIESPIEQNKRHVELLQRAIEDRKLAPNRIGVSPAYKSYILIAPNANVYRPAKEKFDSTCVVKADAFITHLGKEVDKTPAVSVLAAATRLVGADTMESFARKILMLHRPGKFNYAARFGVDEKAIECISTSKPSITAAERTKATTSKTCVNCGSEVDDKVAYFCRINKSKFQGMILCRTCQTPPTSIQEPQPRLSIDVDDNKGLCESCKAPVDRKVIYFCRINKAKFGGRVLCRGCQQSIV